MKQYFLIEDISPEKTLLSLTDKYFETGTTL